MPTLPCLCSQLVFIGVQNYHFFEFSIFHLNIATSFFKPFGTSGRYDYLLAMGQKFKLVWSWQYSPESFAHMVVRDQAQSSMSIKKENQFPFCKRPSPLLKSKPPNTGQIRSGCLDPPSQVSQIFPFIDIEFYGDP